MTYTRLGHWGGLAAMLGGLMWAVWAVLVARKPEGCVGSGCDLGGRASRGYGDLMPLLGIALLLIAAGVLGVVIRARAAGRFGRLGRWGVALAVAGAVVLVAAVVVQALFYDGDFPYMPTVVIPAGILMSLGLLLFAAATLRVLPRWAGLSLVAGTVALAGVNDQNERILLAIPFGMAWIVIGYALWNVKDRSPAARVGA